MFSATVLNAFTFFTLSSLYIYVTTNSSTAFFAHATLLLSSLLLFIVIVVIPVSLLYCHEPNLFSSAFPKFAEPSFPFVAFVEYAATLTSSAVSFVPLVNSFSFISPASNGFTVIIVFSIGYILFFIPDFTFTCINLFCVSPIVYVLFVIISVLNTFVSFLSSSVIEVRFEEFHFIDIVFSVFKSVVSLLLLMYFPVIFILLSMFNKSKLKVLSFFATIGKEISFVSVAFI